MQDQMREQQIGTLVIAAEKLGPNALSLLVDIAERLVRGKEHGDFEAPLDWDREAREEDLDGIVYRTMALRVASK